MEYGKVDALFGLFKFMILSNKLNAMKLDETL